MNKWIELSIEYANQRSYLDDLFVIYPTIPDGLRSIDSQVWEKVEQAFKQQNNIELLQSLMDLNLFPIKDSYIAYLRRDKSAMERNPKTVNRICGRLYELGLDKIYQQCSEPKETNRQIGPMFKRWLGRKSLGILPVDIETFTSSKADAILDASDKVMMDFACSELNYRRNKGLDFVARFNGKYVIGEAKFLTESGGHQNAQFEDAINTLTAENVKAEKIAILDGIPYIQGNNKMYKAITERYKEYNIMSALVLRNFLYQL